MNRDLITESVRMSRGGLYYDLQRRLGIVKDEELRTVLRALILVLVAWAVPLAISVFEGTAFGSYAESPFLLYLPVLSRFLIGVFLLVVMEPVVESQLEKVLRPLLSPPLLGPISQPAAESAASVAVRRRNSRSAEMVCLAVACLCSVGAGFGLSDFDKTPWVFAANRGGESFSYTALWCLWVSSPIYFFLLARWMWRIIIVALFLRSLAALDLRLAVSHPDGAGGVGIVGGLPNAYTLFVLALSCNLAAAIEGHLSAATITTTSFSAVMLTWLLITNGLLALPSLFFTQPLRNLKERTLEVARAQATRHELRHEREVLGETLCGATDDEIQQVAAFDKDPKVIFDAAQNLSTVLIQRSSLLPISVAAVLPVVVAGATLLPIKDVFQILRKLLFF